MLVIIYSFIVIYFLYSLFLKKISVALNLLKVGVIGSGFLQIILALSYSIIQGLIWTNGDNSISKALTPPFSSFNYIAGYSWAHFLKTPTFTIIGALGLFYLLKLINKIGHDRFFYEEEYWLAALGCLAVGFPNLILYFFISAFLNVLAHIIAMVLKKEGRISLLYMWPIAMIITIIFGNRLAILTGLIQLKP